MVASQFVGGTGNEGVLATSLSPGTLNFQLTPHTYTRTANVVQRHTRTLSMRSQERGAPKKLKLMVQCSPWQQRE